MKTGLLAIRDGRRLKFGRDAAGTDAVILATRQTGIDAASWLSAQRPTSAASRRADDRLRAASNGGEIVDAAGRNWNTSLVKRNLPHNFEVPSTRSAFGRAVDDATDLDFGGSGSNSWNGQTTFGRFRMSRVGDVVRRLMDSGPNILHQRHRLFAMLSREVGPLDDRPLHTSRAFFLLCRVSCASGLSCA